MRKHFLFCGPSGSGKTSVVHYLLAQFPFMRFSVSATTRTKRHNEVDGQDYYFLSVEEFQKKIDEGAFIEWEQVYEGRYYGTLHSEIERIEAMNCSVIFDVDVEGGMTIKKCFGDNLLTVFIRPPSVDDLRQRLIARSTETAESLKKRLDKSVFELGFEKHFDNVIVNSDLEEACKKAKLLVEKFLGTDSSK
ncbi:MAG: guanylate kinase [Bacteroidetes bacterium]|jgi:guanylate kinase|nr:guanylate kinase [Bacteroidota bacterium]